MKAVHAESTIRVGLAEAIAETVMGGIRECACEQVPLTDQQQALLWRNALMTYQSSADATLEGVRFDEQMVERLTEIRPESRRD